MIMYSVSLCTSIVGLKNQQLVPIADTPSNILQLALVYNFISRHFPLPSPINYHGEIQYMPFFSEMIQCLPPCLQFNIEIKYPMPVRFISPDNP